MKKIYFLVMCLFASIGLYAQQITGLQVVEVLASDDFEDDEPWINFDQSGIDLTLNNALGGTQTYNWSDAWGGACVHLGKSAVSGEKCVQLHWGGTLVLQGFEIDPAKVYQLEIAVHPQGGMSGQWNNWAAVHLFVFDQSNIWQSQGIRTRLSNNDQAGGSPSLFAYDVWSGENGTEKFVNMLSFSEQIQAYTVNDAQDPAATGFWIPLKMVFKGNGDTEDPLIIDYYLNDIFIHTAVINDLVWKGDSMIGIQNGADNADLNRYDNFRLSVLGEPQGINPVTLKKLSVGQHEKGTLKINSDIHGKNTGYKLFNVTGMSVAQGVLTGETTAVPVGNLSAGVYILHVSDRQTGESRSIRTVIR
ncbi:MAG: T9SS type A sorting domain-containing protein [Dysgonamonadaceae bacterium]|jgi:hypothetical protein|nr:T9SS type A sorting domain-containing protein [Dysgonamonadaceae bacterium]